MRKGLVIDTNLLLLFIIGFIDDARFIKSSNRLSAYSKEDYKILLEIMSQFQTLYITPYIAADGVCQASCPISYAANTAFLSNSLLSFDGFSQTSLTGFQWRTERFFQRSGLASLAVS
ncbi:Uncharacterised protein [Oligella ureolytica]|nr:Uncharacterised protein [Oligella ureolytica]